DDKGRDARKRAYCLKTQPATGETYPKSDLFIDGRLLFAKLNMLWWLYWSSIAAIDPDFAEVM
ncbi:hypothetical protein ACWASX_005825, partial [Klebsiella variicola]